MGPSDVHDNNDNEWKNTTISRTSTTYSTHSRTVHRPFKFFYPTHAVLTPHPPSPRPDESPLHWSSRTSRKGRIAPRQVHVVHLPSTTPTLDSIEKAGTELRGAVVEQRLRNAQTHLKVHLTWDVSFWVALIFTIGSMLWVINGFLLYLPLAPSHSQQHPDAAMWIAFVGGTAFEVGSYLMVVEALNTGHEQVFGPALWGLLGDWDDELKKAGGVGVHGTKLSVRKRHANFRWFGTASWKELGFLASAIQLLAATVFWVSTITGLPGVIPNLLTSPPVAVTDVFFWTPQVVGGTGFIVSSLLLMIECQRKWWLPNLRSLGWHIGVWNLIGAVGFTLCGALGYASSGSSKANYQSVLATFWGSWAFLTGSVIQLYETLWREDFDAGTSLETTSE